MSETVEPTTQKNGWGIKEIVNVVLFGVLTGVLLMLGATFTIFNDAIAMIFSGPVGVLLAAPVFVLMVRRVDRFGVATVFGVLFGVFIALAKGDLLLSVYYIFFAVLMDVIFLRKREQRRKSGNVIGAWSLWSLAYVFGTLIPVFKDKQKYFDAMEQSPNYTDEYIAAFEHYWMNPVWVGIILAISVAFGALGAWFGARMTRKHFEKAGVL
ncbi:MAG: MptD family putative ECF transporter S component [Actinomycetaceae bacterium]|nr:MptD family putative ECF transporter S component [Actinomycetaceae bacterium]